MRAAPRVGITAYMAAQGETRWAKQAAAVIAGFQEPELRDDLRLRFDERAAICEIDGKLTRSEAERVAHDEVVAAASRLRRAAQGSS